MFHAPTAEAKSQKDVRGNQPAPEPVRELSPFVPDMVGPVSSGAAAGSGAPRTNNKGIARQLASLHSMYGNQAILRTLAHAPAVLQTKLAVNKPGDQFEQEADRVADQVMRMTVPPPSIQRKCSSYAAEEEKVQRKCAECEEEEKKTGLQKKETGAGPQFAPPSVQTVLNSPGRPMDAATRAFMEPRFGHDFSKVRVHTDARAAESASAVNALAYTVGNHIVFAGEQYKPATMPGRKLLAHELTHTLQQSNAEASLQRAICSGQPQFVASMGTSKFALCDFTDASRVSAGAIPRPRPGKEAGFVEMRALGIALFGYVGYDLPTTATGAAPEMAWQHGFIQTVQSLKYKATYQRGWSSVREVATPRRDATGTSVPGSWYANQSIPNFQYEVGKKTMTISGPIALGPEFIGTDPVGILDDPGTILAETVPINADPVCPCSWLQTIEAKGELDTWLVVTPTGKGTSLDELIFLKHVETKFDLKADNASGWAVQGAPTMSSENGKGKKTPVLTGPLANDDLKQEKLTEGSPCPVTIPSVKCPVESPTGPP